ncbi:hypothetical protein VNO78_04465 [Psophocarpus tetragonolobus]|uniref:Uncharacterized protein n=1 Tax=Psophocarpus tetragonolobus TaxID=3891 RepID=A0AAN9XWB2_PSOTE
MCALRIFSFNHQILTVSQPINFSQIFPLPMEVTSRSTPQPKGECRQQPRERKANTTFPFLKGSSRSE